MHGVAKRKAMAQDCNGSLQQVFVAGDLVKRPALVLPARGLPWRPACEYDGRRNFTGYHFWARGYCVSTVGLVEEVIRAYIRDQETAEKKQEQLELG